MHYTTDQIQSDKLIKKNHILIKMKLYSINMKNNSFSTKKPRQ